jgi:hypothetical protein
MSSSSEALRRQLQREGISQAVLEQVLQKERIKAINYTVHVYGVIVANVLADKYDFTGDEVKRVLGEVTNLYDSMSKGYVSVDEIEAQMKEEGVL